MLKEIVKQRHSEYIESILQKETRIDWGSLSHNPNITLEIIQQNPDKPWYWYSISYNSNITWEIIQQNLDKPWN